MACARQPVVKNPFLGVQLTLGCGLVKFSECRNQESVLALVWKAALLSYLSWYDICIACRTKLFYTNLGETIFNVAHCKKGYAKETFIIVKQTASVWWSLCMNMPSVNGTDTVSVVSWATVTRRPAHNTERESVVSPGERQNQD